VRPRDRRLPYLWNLPILLRRVGDTLVREFAESLEIMKISTGSNPWPRVSRRFSSHMAARRKKAARGRKPAELIISKTRTKAAVKKCNVGGEFYGALDAAVRQLIKEAEARAIGNKRKTLKAVDL